MFLLVLSNFFHFPGSVSCNSLKMKENLRDEEKKSSREERNRLIFHYLINFPLLREIEDDTLHLNFIHPLVVLLPRNFGKRQEKGKKRMKKNHCTATRSIIKRKKKEKKKPGRRRRVKEEKEKETEDVSISNSFFSQNLNQVIVSYEVFRLDCHSCLLDVTSISHPFSVYFLCVLSVSSKCCLAFTKRNIRKRDVPVMQK